MQRARVVVGYRRCASLVTDAVGAYPASPWQDDADDKGSCCRTKSDGLVFFFFFFFRSSLSSIFFPLCSNVCHRISRRSAVVSSAARNRRTQSVNACVRITIHNCQELSILSPVDGHIFCVNSNCTTAKMIFSFHC